MKRSALKKLNSYSPDSSTTTKLVKIGEASELIGVSIDTLRRWEKKGWLKAVKTPGGTRLYDKEQRHPPFQLGGAGPGDGEGF